MNIKILAYLPVCPMLFTQSSSLHLAGAPFSCARMALRTMCDPGDLWLGACSWYDGYLLKKKERVGGDGE